MSPSVRRLLALACLGGAGCAEEPSFVLRWRITTDPAELGDPEAAAPISGAVQCSAVGLGELRLSTYSGTQTGTLADSRVLPCFPPDFADPDARAGGPELPPATYAVVLEGLRDTGIPWTRVLCPGTPVPVGWDCAEPEDLCLPAGHCGTTGEGGGCDVGKALVGGTRTCRFARASTTVEIQEEGQRVTLEDLVLLAPPECDDGVDNDRDGLTDLADPACLRDPLGAAEIDDTTATLVSVAATYLDENPNVSCAGLGIGQVVVRLDDGETVKELARTTCEAPRTTLSPVAIGLEPGDYTLEIVGIAAATEDEEATQPELHEFSVVADIGTLVDVEVDFGPDDFLVPLQSPLRFKIDYQATPEHVRGSCPPGPGEGLLCVEQIEVRVFEDDVPMDIDLGSFGAGTTVTGDCVAIPLTSTEVFVWGQTADDYSVEAIARGRPVDDQSTCPDPAVDPAADCFATVSRIRLAPGSDYVSVPLPRVLDDQGLPPPGCADCQVDDDCDLACSDCCIDQVCHLP